MRDSIQLYNHLAAEYDLHFEVPHRKAYDQLALNEIMNQLPAGNLEIIDAGCGIGRWAEHFISQGHHITGIEQAPAMIAQAKARLSSPEFTLIEGDMEQAVLPDSCADIILAMGSLQYSRDPGMMIKTFFTWLRPGGFLFLLYDSKIGLVMELIRDGKEDMALQRARSGLGTWQIGDLEADLHLFTSQVIEDYCKQAGFTGLKSKGLLVGASSHGIKKLIQLMSEDYDRQLKIEKTWMDLTEFADIGKQILSRAIK